MSVSNSAGSATSSVAVLTVALALTSYTDDFESGNLDKLPWTFCGNASWQIETNSVSSGRFAARSGVLGDSQSSSLNLTVRTLAGTGSFDVRVSSEPDWDKLQFYLNGQLVQQWSGEVGWQDYQFAVPAGTNALKWRYQKDAMMSEGEDAAYIDNLFLPMPATTVSAPSLSITRYTSNEVLIDLEDESSSGYVLQRSADLRSWSPVATNWPGIGLIQWVVPSTNPPCLFYRALAQ